MTRTLLPGLTRYTASARLLGLACLWAGLAVLLPAHGAAGPNSSAATLYLSYCSVCHGEKGDGKSRAQNSLNPPPRDFTATQADALPRSRMLESVSNGRPGTAMAAWKTQLKPAQIEAVVDYVRLRFMGLGEAMQPTQASRQPRPAAPPAKPAAVNMAAPMPRGLTGDADKGGTFYLANCATCHGKAGDGRGPRAYFINPKPRNFLHTASRQELNRVKLFEMISDGERGTEMPAWKQVLSPQEIANVAEFVFQRFIRAGTDTTKAAR